MQLLKLACQLFPNTWDVTISLKAPPPHVADCSHASSNNHPFFSSWQLQIFTACLPYGIFLLNSNKNVLKFPFVFIFKFFIYETLNPKRLMLYLFILMTSIWNLSFSFAFRKMKNKLNYRC